MRRFIALERPLVDLLTARTTFPWEVSGRHDVALRQPVGIVEQGGGGNLNENGVDVDFDIELDVSAANRSGLWEMVRQADAVMQSLNPGAIRPDGGLFVDVVEMAFNWRLDPSNRASGQVVAEATYTLTMRPQR